MVLDISTKIDLSGINKGLDLAQRYTKRTPAMAANTAACEVAIVAKNTMPYVPVSRIDMELGTRVTARVGKRGKPLDTKYSKNRILSGERMGDEVKDVPLTVLIILARANLAGLNRKDGTGTVSNYNVRTNSRYAIEGNPLAGVSRQEGQAAMAALEDQMIKNRRRSGHFLMVGWTPAVVALLAVTDNRWRLKSATGPPLEGSSSYYRKDLGEAIPAQEGSTFAVCIISNYIGGEGKNAFSFNRALWLYGLGPLQRALDGEGARQMQYYLDKSAEDLAAQVNAIWRN